MADERDDYLKDCIKNIIASSHLFIGNTNDTPEQVSIKLLKQRFEASKKAFVILYQNDCKYEATIIAGYMFELLASIYQFEQRKKTTNDIMGNMAYKYMEMLLQYPRNSDPAMWDEYFKTALDVLQNFGDSILKNSQNVYKILANETISQDEKLKILGKNYKGKPIQNAINEFIDSIKSVIKKWGNNYKNADFILRNFYISYCCFKHNNFLSYLPQERDIAEVVCFMSLIAYYNNFHELDSLEEKYKKLFGEN